MHTKACLEKNPKYKKLSRPAQKRVSKKIAILRREGKSVEQAAAMALSMERSHRLGPKGGYKRNPIEDKDVQMCAMSLHYLARFPHMVENIPGRIMAALIAEGLWDEKEMEVTGKGEKFLLSLEE